jgi:hypothetical protein
VLRASAQQPPANVRDDVQVLLALATGGQEDDLRTALLDYASRAAKPLRADPPKGARPARHAVAMEIDDGTRLPSIVR